MRTLSGHRWAIRAAAYCPCSTSLLAAAGDDGVLRVWDTAGARCVHEVAIHSGGILALAFSADGGHLVTGCRRGTLAVWRTGDWQPTTALHAVAAPVMDVGFIGTEVALAAFQGTGGAAEAGPFVSWRWQTEEAPEQVAWSRGVTCLAASPCDRWLAVAMEDCSLDMYESRRGWVDPSLRLSRPARRLAFAPAPVGVLAVALGSAVELWDPVTRRRLTACKGHRGAVQALAFTPDGRFLLSGSADRSVRAWDVASGKEVASYRWDLGPVNALAVAPDGMTAVAGGDRGPLTVWDLDLP